LVERAEIDGFDLFGRVAEVQRIAWVMFEAGLWKEGISLRRKELRRKELRLGVYHPATMACIGNLALALSSNGQAAKAEALHRQEH
jgi:hypothetical protein